MMQPDSKSAQNAALMAAFCAFILALCKFILFFTAGSLIIALSALDSSMDVVISLVNRKILKISTLDADENHPYGHGRVESIAALGQGCLILGGSLAIIFSSIKQIILNLNHPELVVFNSARPSHVVFFLLAAVVSFFIAKGLRAHGKKLDSPALLADAEHYGVDFITNIASALGLLVVLVLKSPICDAFIAFLFALYIVYGALKLLRTSVNELMDHDIPNEVKMAVRQLIHDTNPNIIDVHKLRGRKAGQKYYFDCHVTLPNSLSFNDVHEIIEEIEVALEKKYGGDMTIHADPDNINDDLKVILNHV